MPIATLESALHILMHRRHHHGDGARVAIHATIAALRVAHTSGV